MEWEETLRWIRAIFIKSQLENGLKTIGIKEYSYLYMEEEKMTSGIYFFKATLFQLIGQKNN